jgi:hypothetical protein
MEKHHATVEIIWQEPETIQKRVNLGQAIYAANIRFAGIDGLWSVVLLLKDLTENKQDPSQPNTIRIGFLFPEQVIHFLKDNMEFTITEGPVAIIGSGKVLSIQG